MATSENECGEGLASLLLSTLREKVASGALVPPQAPLSLAACCAAHLVATDGGGEPPVMSDEIITLITAVQKKILLVGMLTQQETELACMWSELIAPSRCRQRGSSRVQNLVEGAKAEDDTERLRYGSYDISFDDGDWDYDVLAKCKKCFPFFRVLF